MKIRQQGVRELSITDVQMFTCTMANMESSSFLYHWSSQTIKHICLKDLSTKSLTSVLCRLRSQKSCDEQE